VRVFGHGVSLDTPGPNIIAGAQPIHEVVKHRKELRPIGPPRLVFTEHISSVRINEA
jgi:hypothetical protein